MSKEKTDNNNLAVKAGMIYLIAELITRGISFLITPVFSRILPADIFANAKVFESWCYLLAPVLSLSIYQSVPRAKFDFEKSYDKYLSGVLKIQTIITFAFIGLLFLCSGFVAGYLGYDKLLIFFIPVYCWGYNSIQSIQIYDRQVLNYKRNIALTFLGVIPGIVIAILSILCYKRYSSGGELLYVRIFGFLGPTALIGIILCVFFLVKDPGPNKIPYRYMLRNSLPIMITTLATQIFYQMGNIITKQEAGAEAAALLIIAMTVGYIMDILVHAIDNAWKPWMFEKLNTGNPDTVKKTWILLLGTVSVLILGLTLFAPEMVWFFGGSGYEESVELVPVILLASLINFVFITYTSLEQYLEKPEISGITSVLASVFCIVINKVLIGDRGVQMAPVALFLSYTFGILLHIVLIRKHNPSDILKVWESFGIIAVVACIQYLFTKLYSVSFIGRFSGTLLIMVVAAVLLRKQLVRLINMVWKR